MSPTDADIDSENVFAEQQIEESSLTRSDRYRRFVAMWIVAPFRVLWGDWRARLGLIITTAYLVLGIVGPLVIDPTHTNQHPKLVQPFQNMAYPLGTDDLGQDILAQAVHATPAMLIMVAAGGLFTIVLGTTVGTVAGYRGGRVDAILTQFTDVVLNIPGLPLLVVLAAIFEPRSAFGVGILLAINAWAGLARSIRSEVLTLRDQGYVESSRLMGVSHGNIILRDVLPNIMPFILINFVTAARNIIFASVGLYFLGILPFTNQNWGVMLNTAYQTGALMTEDMYHWVIVPTLLIIFLSAGLILLSQGLDRVFNPRVRARHIKNEQSN